MKKVEEKIIAFLKSQEKGKAFSHHEIAASINEEETVVVKTLNRIPRDIVDIVPAKNEHGLGTVYYKLGRKA